MDAIATYDLTKRFGSRVALDKLNLQIPQGDSFACVGERGSGKTTLVRLLAGLSRPDSGECETLGLSPFFEASRLHTKLGVVVSAARLYREMSLSDNLSFFAGVNGVDKNDAIDRSSFLLHRLDIWENREDKVEALSTGAAFRASVARALVHRPQVLLLDVFGNGLDRETADSVRELLRLLVREEGLTLLLCTENALFAQQVCRRFGLLKEGVMLARGDLESLGRDARVFHRGILRLAEGERPLRGFRPTENGWERRFSTEEEFARIIADTVSEGITVYEARLIPPTLEEIYAACLAGGSHRAGEDDEQDEYERETEYDRNGGGEEKHPHGGDEQGQA